MVYPPRNKKIIVEIELIEITYNPGKFGIAKGAKFFIILFIHQRLENKSFT